MAVVHFGRLLGQAGFSRTVAIKRLHPQFATDPDFVAMFLDEARLAVRVQHPNVVAPLDVVVADGELLVVMDYVSGETLSQLIRQASQPAPPPIIARVLVDALYGLHAAHEAVAEDGSPLEIVHRDISPQNIIVGVDGIARVLDFGVAKAAMRSHATKDGEIKGKLAYMAPEQLKSLPIDRRVDLFAAGVVLWECLTRQRLFRGEDLGQTVELVLHSVIAAPSTLNPAVPARLDAMVRRALEREPAARFQTAREQASALQEAVPLATPSQVADWVRELGGARLSQRMERARAIESRSSSRLKVTGRSPLHTPQGLMPASALSSGAWAASPEAPPLERAADPGGGEPPATPSDRNGAVANVADSSRVGAPLASGWRPRVVLGVVAAAAVTTGVAGSWLVGRASPVAPSLTAPSSASSPEAGRAPAAPVVTGSFVATSAEVLPAVSTQAASTPTATPTRSQPRAGVSKTAPTLAKASAKPASTCNPPFEVDERGIRRIKQGCR
jgi:serine/threonine-protein kinase